MQRNDGTYLLSVEMPDCSPIPDLFILQTPQLRPWLSQSCMRARSCFAAAATKVVVLCSPSLRIAQTRHCRIGGLDVRLTIRITVRTNNTSTHPLLNLRNIYFVWCYAVVYQVIHDVIFLLAVFLAFHVSGNEEAQQCKH